MSKGWISLNRKIQEHWLWGEKRVFSKLEAWLDLLLSVNHTEQEVLIKNKLFIVKRGESIKSLDTWGNRWNWNKSKVRRFLNLLEQQSMIVTKNERKTTRLTICKYDTYQDVRNANETRMKHERNANETQVTLNNNDNNINNENNIIYTAQKFLQRWKDARMYYDKKPTNISKLTPQENVMFNELLKTYSEKDFEEAIAGLFFQDTFKAIRLRPTHFLNLENFEKYLTCYKNKEILFPKKKNNVPDGI